MIERDGSTIQDHKLAKQAAVASRNQYNAVNEDGGAGLIGEAAAVVQAWAQSKYLK